MRDAKVDSFSNQVLARIIGILYLLETVSPFIFYFTRLIPDLSPILFGWVGFSGLVMILFRSLIVASFSLRFVVGLTLLLGRVRSIEILVYAEAVTTACYIGLAYSISDGLV